MFVRNALFFLVYEKAKYGKMNVKRHILEKEGKTYETDSIRSQSDLVANPGK